MKTYQRITQEQTTLEQSTLEQSTLERNNLARQVTASIKLSLLCLSCLLANQTAVAGSKRIEVYQHEQSYYDVKPGDSLSSIVMRLLPDNPVARKLLMQQLVEKNPHAFIEQNPDRLKVNSRLWFSDQHKPLNIKDPEHYSIKKFSWGQVYKPKRQ